MNSTANDKLPFVRAVVVGAGVVGTFHAFHLVRQGHDVVHLEAEVAPQGASIRNFGLVWVSGRRTGPELQSAQRARVIWGELAAVIPGIGFRPDGSLTVACSADEAKVMEQFGDLDDANERGTRFLDRADLHKRFPAIGGDVHGALWCQHDAIVEPSRVLGSLREYLSVDERYHYHPGRRVMSIDRTSAIDQLGERHDADVVIVTTGAAHNALLAQYLADAPLQKVRLQMAQTARFDGRLPTAVADADSMRYYPAYEVAPLDILAPQNPVARAHHLQLLLVQRANGELTIGDTHAYDEPFEFRTDETPYLELIERAERILGVALPPLQYRWEGVYSKRTDDGVCFRQEVEPGVWIVTGPGGRGMTCSPAIAEETVQEMGLAA